VPELNLDGIVGPTHNYAGLSAGNVASTLNQGADSHPRQAARQGLAKMAAVAALGVPQGFLPPHERPHVPTLRRLGFSGRDEEVVERAARDAPELLACASSASAMWAANAATVTPSVDSGDGRVHFTPANLRSMFHRSIEPPQTARLLRAVFPDADRFVVHEPLPATGPFGDEGAANHSRFTRAVDAGGERPGVHLFVYGAAASGSAPAMRLRRAPARQDRDASVAIVRHHGIAPACVIYAQQHPDAIDQGVFHNDVISVGHGSFFLVHEDAFAGGVAPVEEALRRAFEALPRAADRTHGEFVVARVGRHELSVADAVRCYLFNSQLVTCADGTVALVAPRECEEDPSVRAVVDRLIADRTNPLSRVLYLDVRESMRNGGGPACLRLRVPLTGDELGRVNERLRFTADRHARLNAWVDRHYPETLSPRDLGDPQLLRRSREALDALTTMLELGPIYDFQR